MIKSMTAFGRCEREYAGGDITVEIRSVNSRFLDCSVRMPRNLSAYEERVKSLVQKHGTARGKVDVYITVNRGETDLLGIAVDESAAEQYIAALRTLRDRFGLIDDISVMSVAKNSSVFKYEKAEEDLDAEWAVIEEVLLEALSSHADMRTSEGERIRKDLEAKVEAIRAYADEVEGISREDTVGYRDRLESRIRQILGEAEVELDENRLLTECAVWADKIAIDEELVRLRSHIDAFYEISALPEPSGRKLDFLIQEFNRETNTIGSKANNARIARIVVDMKGEIEKMREQIQNVE